MVSSSSRRKGQAFTTMTPLCRRLSIVRILPRIASHPKACTPGGALNFHMLATLHLKEGVHDIAKKEETENVHPSKPPRIYLILWKVD